MIPVLFPADSTDFNTYGIGILADCLSCEVAEERNGVYECKLTYPITGVLYSEIKNERLVKAKPNDTSLDQIFRIYRVTTPIDGVVTIYAQHISYDLSNIAVLPWASSSISPPLAMQRLFSQTTSGHNFTCSTDLSQPRSFSISKPQSIRACLGGTKGSFLDVWGGEYEWDNYKVILHFKRGRDTGVVIEYGKNLTELEHDDDNTHIYTHLLPYAVYINENGSDTVVTLTEVTLPIVTADISRTKTLIKDFTDFFEPETTITEDQLRSIAQSYLESNPLGTALPTITISFEPLWKLPEYSALLERVSLCDIVTIRHSKLRIATKSKVVSTVYDTLAERYNSITLGSAKSNLLNTVSDIQTVATETKNKINRLPSLMEQAIRSATSLITGQSGGYVVICTDSETGYPNELLILDNPDIHKAVHVWRWNMGGLGFSKTGYNGPYETAITADGQIVADFITSGSLIANIIKAGVLQSQDGSSYWDLDSGEIVIKSYAKSSDLDEANSRINEIQSKRMYRLVISSSNGNIFKNGEIETTLYATVFSWDEDITDTLDPNQFIWTRKSDDAAADDVWNDAHYGGTKQITITSDDVNVRATFFCDLIDTTTRYSLLS